MTSPIESFAACGIRQPELFEDFDTAVARLSEHYAAAAGRLAAAFQRFVKTGEVGRTPDACYPFVGVRLTPRDLNLDGRLAYGVLHDPGLYGTTLTRPTLFGDYYRTQLGILWPTTGCRSWSGISGGRSRCPSSSRRWRARSRAERLHELQYLFPMPDLSRTDDAIANGTWRAAAEEPAPLALFTAERVDYSLHRLHHYTGTQPEHFQRFVLLTNYQRYVDHFVDAARREVAEGQRV